MKKQYYKFQHLQNNTFSTLFVGQNIIKLKEVDSTNNFLKDLASKSAPLAEGTVIMADHQFAGRGQQASVWKTEPGMNISMSILLKPSFLALAKHFYLNMAISLGICEALSLIANQPLSIKWPNDIYYNSQKLGGILIENTLTGNKIKSAIIGIGLNVNQKEFDAELSSKATSLYQILHKHVSLEAVMDKIFVYIEKYYLNLRSEKYDFLSDAFLKHLYKFNTPSLYRSNGQVFEGTITGVEEGGQLRVSIDGRTESFNLKEIEFLHTQ